MNREKNEKKTESPENNLAENNEIKANELVLELQKISDFANIEYEDKEGNFITITGYSNGFSSAQGKGIKEIFSNYQYEFNIQKTVDGITESITLSAVFGGGFLSIDSGPEGTLKAHGGKQVKITQEQYSTFLTELQGKIDTYKEINKNEIEARLKEKEAKLENEGPSADDILAKLENI